MRSDSHEDEAERHEEAEKEKVIPDACADKLITRQSVSRCCLEFFLGPLIEHITNVEESVVLQDDGIWAYLAPNFVRGWMRA